MHAVKFNRLTGVTRGLKGAGSLVLEGLGQSNRVENTEVQA